jgi:hypothetical protein
MTSSVDGPIKTDSHLSSRLGEGTGGGTGRLGFFFPAGSECRLALKCEEFAPWKHRGLIPRFTHIDEIECRRPSQAPAAKRRDHRMILTPRI